MKTPATVKRSIVISGHKTSVSLEDEFWNCLREIAGERSRSASGLIDDINAEREFANLSSAIRMFILRHYCDLVDKQASLRELEPLNSIEHRTP
jgi:predicted DNA-binding ribbon-helix-helix protein